VFYGGSVTGAKQDRLMAARIAAITRRHARGRALTGVEEAAALAELAEVAHGRVDLLAEEAGLAIGFHDQDIDAPRYLQIAQLCIKAGADTSLISGWIEEGRRRAAAVRQTPFTG
jgi:hypothetical protein